MKLTCSMALFFSAMFFGCENAAPELLVASKNIPACVSELTDDEESNVLEVWKWVLGKTVFYYLKSDCCDQYNYLYNQNCERICAPDGGLTGGGDGLCPPIDDGVIKTLVWSKPE